jgi:hypothetical protein
MSTGDWLKILGGCFDVSAELKGVRLFALNGGGKVRKLAVRILCALSKIRTGFLLNQVTLLFFQSALVNGVFKIVSCYIAINTIL